MNFLKFAALSLVMLTSLASAKVTLDAVIADSQGILSIPTMTLELNEPSVQFVGNVRFEATLTESNTIVFDLAFPDEAGNFVSQIHPELALTAGQETKASLEVATRDGNSLLLVVQVNEIQE